MQTINISERSVVILKIDRTKMDGKIEDIEDKYSKKFGCKVIILEHGIEMVECF